MASGEIRGSRRQDLSDSVFTRAWRMFASTDGACGVSEEDEYPGDAAGVTARKAKGLVISPKGQPLPGLYLVTVEYVAAKAM